MATKKSSFNQQRVIKTMWLGAGALVVLVLLVFGLVAAGAFGDLPTFEDLENPNNSLATEVYSADGVLLGKFYFQNRSNASFEEIPALLKNTLIATEDIRFYEHSGVDYR